MISGVPPPALPHLHPALWLAGPARPGRRPPRTPNCPCCGTRSSCCAAPIPDPGLDWANRAVLAALIRLLPGRLRMTGWSVWPLRGIWAKITAMAAQVLLVNAGLAG
jgi:hypothetical protein